MHATVPSGPSRERSYAVTWLEGGSVIAGKLVLGPTGLRLESGAPCGRLTARILRYADLSSVEMARQPAERIRGRPTALLKRPGRASLPIATIDGVGSLHEVVERLAAAVSGATPPEVV